MKLIIGIGNSGKKYERNRHNAGFMVIDTFVSQISNEFSDLKFQLSKKGKTLFLKFKTGGNTVEFLKPQTFMNDSGFSVAYARNKHKIALEDIYVVHDDLDIKLGEYKTQKGKGPRDHKGLLSIYEKLGSKDFWHVRVGVDNRDIRSTDHGLRTTVSIPGEKYVLQNFTDEEMQILESVIDRIVKDLYGRIKTSS